MQTYLSRLTALALLAGGPPATGAPVFEDGFEQGPAAWTVTTTNQGRALATTDHGPATGTRHLVLDDAVNDSTYSVAEATLALDLRFRKNVILRFKAKSLGNEPNPPPAENFTTARNHDAVSVSADGGLTWRSVQSLAAIGTTWTSCVIPLDAAVTQLGGTFGADFRIRFSGYDNAPAPLDGIAIDDVSVSADPDRRAIVELPGPVNEGGGPYTGSVVLSPAADAPVTLTLTTAAGSPLRLPPTVTVPAGATSAGFQYTVEEDDAVTLTRTVTVDAYATGVTVTPGSVTVIDNEVPVVSLALPATVKEGEAAGTATISFNPAPSIPVSLKLTADPASEIIIPSTVTVPAGQSQVNFNVTAVNDTKIDGDIPVVVTLTAAGISPLTAATTAVDNETRAVSLWFADTVREGSSGIYANIAISGVITQPLVISLSVPSGSGVTVPATVTIPAGSVGTNFTFSVAENTDRDGTRTQFIRATADGFITGEKNFVVKDNDIASYVFPPLTDIMIMGVPVETSIQPVDVEGTVITGLSGTANLELVAPDGSTWPLTTASFTNSVWIGTITLPSTPATGLRLRARDAAGFSGTSTPFDAMRTLGMTAADLVWNPARNVIYASVSPGDTTIHANKVVAIDPVTLQVTGSTPTGEDPRRLALTPDGQYLYASLYGSGRIAKINPVTMQLISTFAVGTDPFYGILYAEDICPVPGQPDTVIVSQGRKSNNYHVSEVVYDNGVMRSKKSNGSSSEIEPTADPSIYVGYENTSTSFETNRLKLDADGLTVISTRKSVIGKFTLIQSQGNKVFTGNGRVFDATTLEPTGTFAADGPMRAELADNRVYFLGPPSIVGSFTEITSHDPTTYEQIRKMTMPYIYTSGTGTLIRWGNNGLAFRNGSLVRIVSSSLVPAPGPADLRVNMAVTPDAVAVGSPVTYTVQVTNQGTSPAIATEVTATLSSGQTLDTATASLGTRVITGSVVKLSAGDLAAGASVTLTLQTTPLAAGNPSCQVSATSRTADPDGTNNVDIRFARAGYQTGPDGINTFGLVAKSMIYDAHRNLLWCAIPSTEAAPLGKSVVSVDPATGVISKPIPLGADPAENVIALSGNGRYLYIGLSDVRHLRRIDLQANPPSSVTVPLEVDDYGNTGLATDIEVLEGDGRSVVVCTTGGNQEVNVIDDLTRRTPGNIAVSADTIEPSGTPGVYIVYNTRVSYDSFKSLQVTPTGLSGTQDPRFPLIEALGKAHADGDNLLTSRGYLIDSTTLTLKLNLGSRGSPWVETAKNRAFIVDGKNLRSFDITTGLPAATLTLPTTGTGDWSLSCTRWGTDGMAILGGDGKLHILRWSGLGSGVAPNGTPDPLFLTNPASGITDADHDGMPAAIEYLFGTSPETHSPNPLKSSIKGIPDAPVMVLEFPRRIGLANRYRIQASVDLATWTDAAGVEETVISTQTVGDVTTETVLAEIPMTNGLRFTRIKWLDP